MSEVRPSSHARRLPKCLLIAGIAFLSLTAQADNSLRGLEMDVMEPGETAAHATARIALPRPMDGGTDYRDLEAEQRVRVGSESDRGGILGVDTNEPTFAPGDVHVGEDPAVDVTGNDGEVVVEPIEEPSKPSE